MRRKVLLGSKSKETATKPLLQKMGRIRAVQALFLVKWELVWRIIFEVEWPHCAHTCLLVPWAPVGLAARGP